MNKNIYLLVAVGGVLVASTSCTSDEEPNAPVSDLIEYNTGADATFTAEQLAFPAKKGIKSGSVDVSNYAAAFAGELSAYNVMWYNTGRPTYYLDLQPGYYVAADEEAGTPEISVSSMFVPQAPALANATNGALQSFVASIQASVVDGSLTRVIGMPIKGTALTAAEVADLWPVLEYLEVPLTSPVADLSVATEVEWLADFMALVNSKGLRVDYVGASYYGSYTSLAAMKTAVTALEAYKLPIVITGIAPSNVFTGEVTPASFVGGVSSFMQNSMAWLDAQESVVAYAWDVDAMDPEADLYDEVTGFTLIGQAFMDPSFKPVYAVQPDASTLPAVTAATVPGYAYSFNKAANAGFEEGDASWTLTSAKVISVEESADLGIGLDMYLYDDKVLYLGDGDGSASQTITVDAAKYDEYVFGFVGRVQDEEGKAATGTSLYMVVKDQDGNEIYNGSTSKEAVTTNATSLVSALGTLKGDVTALTITIVKEGGDATNQAFVDKVFISYSDSALLGENLIPNGNIETGSLDAKWVKNQQAIVKRTDAIGYLFCDDSNVMSRFGNANQNFANIAHQGTAGIAVENGVKYRLSVNARITSDALSTPGTSEAIAGVDNTAYLYFTIKPGKNVNPGFVNSFTADGTQLVAKEDFTNFTWDYTIDYSLMGTYTSITPFIAMTKAKGNSTVAYVDNFRLQKVLDPADVAAELGF